MRKFESSQKAKPQSADSWEAYRKTGAFIWKHCSAVRGLHRNGLLADANDLCTLGIFLQ